MKDKEIDINRTFCQIYRKLEKIEEILECNVCVGYNSITIKYNGVVLRLTAEDIYNCSVGEMIDKLIGNNIC